jgi:hypothetical protein
VRSTKARIAKLEWRNPKDPTVIHYIGFDGEPVLTPEEEAVLGAAEEQLKRESKTGFVVVVWTKEEAQRLMLGKPPSKFSSWQD